MNHTLRARGIVGRAMPKTLHLRGLKRRVDMSEWHEELTRAVARGLRQAERDAHRHAIVLAARRVDELGLGDRDLNMKIARQILALEKDLA